MKYSVITLHDASSYEEVEADSPEEAIEALENSPSLCHQCSNELNLGDPYDYRVEDADGNEVLEFEVDKDRRALREARELLWEALDWLQLAREAENFDSADRERAAAFEEAALAAVDTLRCPATHGADRCTLRAGHADAHQAPLGGSVVLW